MKPKILVVYCHPNPKSYSHAVLESVRAGLARVECEVQVLDLHAEAFEPVLIVDEEHRRRDLDKVEYTRRHREQIAWCDAMVFVYPVWWGGFPTMLKGYLDRTFVSGLTYSFQGRPKGALFPHGLMRGKGAHFFYTLDSPSIVAGIDPGWLSNYFTVFRYCGFGPVRRYYLARLKLTTHEQRTQWLTRVEAYAHAIAARLARRRLLKWSAAGTSPGHPGPKHPVFLSRGVAERVTLRSATSCSTPAAQVSTMRTALLRRLRESLQVAVHAHERGIPSREAVDLARTGRRTFLQASGVAIATGATGCAVDLGRTSSPLTLTGSTGIVGAGLAGLACADALTAYGIAASVYEASNRIGGRVYSLGGSFPGPVSFGGQVVERGGELIDTTHTTMRGYATRFRLTLENYLRAPGEVTYHFDGRHVSEAEIVDEYRAFVPAMQADLRNVGSPTADSFTEADAELDWMTLEEYLVSRGAGPIVRKALTAAYEAEYGRGAGEQTALAMLFFLHADRRNRFQPFGIFSDEKYHVAEGNEAIPRALAASLLRPVEHDMRLVRVAKLSDGRIELTLASGRRTVRRVHDAVVLTVPFSVLRGVELHASLGIPAWKRYAIDQFSYGNNAKMMIAFNGRPWATLGSNGSSYSDLPNHQTTWETNWTGSSPTQGVLTDYSSGARGARLDPSRVQREATSFLTDLDRVWRGAAAAARRDRGNVVAHLEHWPSNPLSLGSYTNNAPGYFTTIADNEAKPVGNLFFAGEHTSSFYEWQGFMEGSSLSGLRAAGEVADLLRASRRV